MKIEGRGMDGEDKKNKEKTGPDIGWLPLSTEEAQSVQAQGAVFCNREKTCETFAGEEGIYECQMVFATYLCLESASDVIAGVALLYGKTGGCPTDEIGWDYGLYDFTVLDPRLPRNQGGVSDSSVWRIQLPADGSGSKAFLLDGAVFAEDCKPGRGLVARGLGSIRKVLGET